MLQNRIVPLLFLLVLILEGHHHSEAIPFGRIRSLAQVPPPAPSPESDTSGNNSKYSTGSDKCLLSSHSCSFKNLTACLRYSGNDLKEVFIILENTGESPLQVNVTISPTNKTNEISLSKQQVEEVNVTEKVQGNYAIFLNVSTGSCEIKSSSLVSGWRLPYSTTIVRVTPIYGVYLLLVVAVIVGGVWGCCKFVRSESRVDNKSIRYQELEMAQQPDSINNDVETAQEQDGWGETWDDDWDEDDDGEDEIREVKSLPRKKVNGHSSNRSGDGWDDTWDD